MSRPRTSLPVLGEGGAPADPSRRGFLRNACAGAALASLSACGLEDFFHKSFRELSKEDVARVLARLEKRYSAQYGKQVAVAGTPPREGVEFGYGLDLSRCIGCRRCVYACVKENNQSRAHPQIHWICGCFLDWLFSFTQA